MIKQMLKNLFRRKMRTLLTVSGIAVGVAMIVALGAMSEGLREGYLSMFSGSGADLIMMKKGAYDITLSAVDEDIINPIRALPDVGAVNGLVVGNVTAPNSPYFFVFGYDPAGFAIQRFKLAEGAPLKTASTGSGREILLGKQAAEALKLHLGDVLRLTGGSFRIVGIYTTGSGFEDAAAVMSLADAQQILQKQRQVCAIQIKLKDPRAVDRVRARLEKAYPKLTISGSSQAANQQDMVTMIQGFAWGIAFLAILIGGVGMTNTVLMSAFERTREIGTLRALGWSRRRVVAMVLGESVLLGFAGGALGAAAGAALIGPMSNSPALSFLQGRLSWTLVAQGLITAMILGAAGGLYPAWWASRLMPIEALRYEGGSQQNGNGHSARLAQLRLPGPLADLWRSLWRRRGRTVLTLVGISIGLAAVITMSGIADGFIVIFGQLISAQDADLVARQSGASDLGYSAINERAGRQIAAISGVQNVSGLAFGAVTMEQVPYVLVMGYDPNEYAIRHFKIVSGRGLVGSHEAILGRQTLDMLKVQVGDTLRLGEMGLRVVGVFETGVSFEETAVVVPLRDAQSLLGKAHQVSLYSIKVKNVQEAEAIRAAIEKQVPDVSLSLASEFAESVPDLQNTYAMVWAISALAVITGGIGMMNTMFMSVFERTREIGTLRALGWRRRQVLGMVLSESLTLGLVGMLVGLVLAVGLSALLQQIPMWGDYLAVQFSLRLIVQTMAVAVLLGSVGGLYPAWRASNLRPVEALRYE